VKIVQKQAYRQLVQSNILIMHGTCECSEWFHNARLQK